MTIGEIAQYVKPFPVGGVWHCFTHRQQQLVDLQGNHFFKERQQQLADMAAFRWPLIRSRCVILGANLGGISGFSHPQRMKQLEAWELIMK